MPLTVGNTRDLLLVVLSDLLFVERQFGFEVIPALLKEVKAPDLARSLSEHLEPTKRHAEALEQVFRLLGAEPSPYHSDPFQGLVDRYARLSGSIVDERLADVFHAQAAAHTEHYEIAAYSAAIALARGLGHADAVEALEGNLADERRALAELEQAIAELSQRSVEA